MKTLMIWGAGRHGRVVAEAAESSGQWRVVGYVDDALELRGKLVHGIPVHASTDVLPEAEWVVAVGNNAVRRELFVRLRGEGKSMATVIAGGVSVSPRAEIGAGSVVLPGAVISYGAKVGENVIINSGAILDHDVEVGDHAHVGLGFVAASFTKIPAGEKVVR